MSVIKDVFSCVNRPVSAMGDVQYDGGYDSDDTESVASVRETVKLIKKRAGGMVSNAKNKTEVADHLGKKALQKDIVNRQLDVRKKDKVARETKEKWEREHAKAKSLAAQKKQIDQQYMSLRAESEQHHHPPKSMMEELTHLESAAEVAREKFIAQANIADREEQMLKYSERVRDTAQLSAFKDKDHVNTLNRYNAETQAAEASGAKARGKKEKKDAQNLRNRQEVRKARQTQIAEEAVRLEARQVDQAKAGFRGAKERVADTTINRKETESAMKQIAQDEWDNRTAAMLELKANTDAAAAHLKGINHQMEVKRKDLENSNKHEFGELLKEGENPYSVFRKRQMDAKEEKRALDRVKSHKVMQGKIAEGMIVEDERIRKDEQKDREHKQYDEAFQKEQGRAAKETKVKSYLQSRTRGGVEMVDPTGRSARIDPSQVTVVRDHGFGLGKSMRQNDTKADRANIIAKVQAKPKNRKVEHDPRFVPKRKGPLITGGEEQVTGEAALLQDEGAPPGQDLQEQKVEEVAVEEDEEGEGAALVGDQRKGFGKPKLTKLEQQYMSMARQRQAANITQDQVVWGKRFEGCPFLSEPKEIRFTDFNVGKVEKRRIVLTNVSFSFNAFKVMSLPDNVKDFFEITYIKPGRMSAGMTCAITITFDPKVNSDIYSELPFLASSGPFSVPLICTTKKSVPSVVNARPGGLPADQPNLRPLIPFENVVLGDYQVFDLIVRNDGALQSEFELMFTEDAEAAEMTGILDENGNMLQMPSSPGPSRHSSAEAGLVERLQQRYVHLGIEEQGLMEKAAKEAAKAEGTKEGEAITFPTTGVIEPYSTKKLKVVFRPHYAGLLEVDLLMRFNQPENEDIHIKVEARALKVPIYIEETVLDFRCCVYRKLYRSRVMLRNRSGVALKMLAQIPPALAGSIEFNPNLGFVQGHDHHSGKDGMFELIIKFRPQPGLMKLCKQYALANGFKGELPGIIAVPVEVTVPDQTLPVYFILRAQLTTADIQLTPLLPGMPEVGEDEEVEEEDEYSESEGEEEEAVEVEMPKIDFGQCFTTQATMMPLRMTNKSALPQKFGFVKLPVECSVQPNDGFGTILPHETLLRQVVFQPKSAIDYKFNLTLKTTLNREFIIPCTGQGKTAPLKISHTVLDFGATAPMDPKSQAIFVTNTTNVSQTFEFSVPHAKKSKLKISPFTDSISPGKTMRVQVDFCPTKKMLPATPEEAAAAEAKAKEAADVKAAEEAKAAEKAAEDKAAEDAAASKKGKKGALEPVAVIQQEEVVAPEPEPEDTILEVEGKVKTSDMAGRGELVAFCGESSSETAEQPTYAGQSASDPERRSLHSSWKIPCFCQPTAKLEKAIPELAPAPDAPILFIECKTAVVERQLVVDQSKVDFGQIAVGKVSVVVLRVSNLSDKEIPLSMRGLNPVGCYSIINALRSIPAKGYRTLQIRFNPSSQLHYIETLTLFSVYGQAKVKLIGHGVSPKLSVDPEDGMMDMGHIVTGESIEKTFTLTNCSVFPLDFHIKPVARSNEKQLSDEHTCFSNSTAFKCVPEEATIPAGEQKEVKMIFSADHERPHAYTTTFLIDVPNQEVDHLVTATGRCWARQGYALPVIRKELEQEKPESEQGQEVEEPTRNTIGLKDTLSVRAPEMLEDSFALPQSMEVKPGVEALPGWTFGVKRIDLQFDKPSETDRPLELQVAIGAAFVGAGSSKKSASVSYTIIPDAVNPAQQYFTCDTPSGACADLKLMTDAAQAAAQTVVTFTFKPPVQEDRGVGYQKAVEDVGQWMETTMRCVLSKGYVPDKCAAEYTIEIHLRGYVTIG
jgi:NAD(P)H-hydrate repair Nnr-like enzyme with NAD(P)H-hydrate epimerase domain